MNILLYTETDALLGSLAIYGFLMVASIIFCVLFAIACYVAISLSIYNLSKKCGFNHPWMAFIPVAQNAKLFNLAGFNDKTFWILTIIMFATILFPVIGTIISLAYCVLSFYVCVRIAENFGGGVGSQVLTCLCSPVMLMYFWLSKKQYVPKPLPQEVEDILRKCELSDNVEANANTQAQHTTWYNTQKNTNQQQEQTEQPKSVNIEINTEKDDF